MKFFPESKSNLTQSTPLEIKFFPEYKSNLTQNTPPQIKNSNFLSRFQIWPYPEAPPLKIENSNFLSRFQIWPHPEHPPKIENSNFLPDSKSDLTQNTPPPMKFFPESKGRLKYVETNGCIPQGYHLVIKVTIPQLNQLVIKVAKYRSWTRQWLNWIKATNSWQYVRVWKTNSTLVLSLSVSTHDN